MTAETDPKELPAELAAVYEELRREIYAARMYNPGGNLNEHMLHLQACHLMSQIPWSREVCDYLVKKAIAAENADKWRFKLREIEEDWRYKLAAGWSKTCRVAAEMEATKAEAAAYRALTASGRRPAPAKSPKPAAT